MSCATVVFARIDIALAAATGLILDVVSVRRTGAATGLNGLARIAGSALGAPVVVGLLSSGSDATGVVLSRSVTTMFWGFAVLMLLAVALVAGLPKRPV